jgi:glycosyltransferase involved in cell wall biosynthesis
VIVVNYNHGSYIRAAIESILNQTFNNFEIIVVDDGSQDNSRTIIKEIIKQSAKKIRFLCHEDNQNLGISKTYKLALSKAKGKYIAFLEADDQWDKNYLQTKVEILDRFHSVGVVFSKYKIMSKSLYGYDMHLRQKWLEIFIEPKRPFSIFQKMIKRNNIATFSAFVTRKSLIDKISIDLPQQFFFLDWWVLLQLSMKSKFYLDKKSVVYWRHHRESTLGKQTFNEHKK